MCCVCVRVDDDCVGVFGERAYVYVRVDVFRERTYVCVRPPGEDLIGATVGDCVVLGALML